MVYNLPTKVYDLRAICFAIKSYTPRERSSFLVYDLTAIDSSPPMPAPNKVWRMKSRRELPVSHIPRIALERSCVNGPSVVTM